MCIERIAISRNAYPYSTFSKVYVIACGASNLPCFTDWLRWVECGINSPVFNFHLRCGVVLCSICTYRAVQVCFSGWRSKFRAWYSHGLRHATAHIYFLRSCILDKTFVFVSGRIELFHFQLLAACLVGRILARLSYLRIRFCDVIR